MEKPCHSTMWQLEADMQTVILCHSIVFVTWTRLFPICPPPGDTMGKSKVTHIYPIKQVFERTNIRLQLMLQWGPESERCYRPKRLGFQGPVNKRQPSPQREREKEGMGRWWGGSMWRAWVHTETVASEGPEASVLVYCAYVVHHFMIESSVKKILPVCLPECAAADVSTVAYQFSLSGFPCEEPSSFHRFVRTCTRLTVTGRRRYCRWVNGAELN